MLCEVAFFDVLGHVAVPRGERAPGAANDEDAHLLVGFGQRDGAQDLAYAARRERVVLLGPVQRDADDVTQLLHNDGGEVVGHDEASVG
jgi:hypothetical protein